MRSTLKRTLLYHLQMLQRDFMCLDLSIAQGSDMQIRSLETLGLSIDRLRMIVDSTPTSQCVLCSVIRHNIFNQVTVISGFAQLLQEKRVGPLANESKLYIEKILAARMHIEAALLTDKANSVEKTTLSYTA
jgi:hypothetical protein